MNPASRVTALATALATAIAAASIAAVGVAPHLPAPAARADVITASRNNLRDGWDSSEPGLASVADGGPVGGPTFGRLFATKLNGEVYAQPVIAGHTVIVGTETNHVYGINAVTGAVKWSDALGPALPSATLKCGDLTPDIGITSTPVYDPGTGTVYLVAVVNDGPTAFKPHVYVYALNAQTGAVRPGWPVPIQGSASNDPSVTFNPVAERQRAGLLLMNGWLYAGFASYCDFQPYVGYVAGVNTSTQATTLWSDESGPTDTEGGIWQAGGGLMSDGPGRIILATGNGVSPPPGPGTSPPGALGDSVVRLSVASNGTMSAADFFSPANAPQLDAADLDFGSGGPVALPFGTSANPDLLVQAGKDGRVFLLNRDALGGREQGSGGSDSAVAVAGPYQGQWGHPATFGPRSSIADGTPASGDFLYYVGIDDVMRYLEVGADNNGTPTLADVANGSNTLGYTSGSPVVTSNGNDPASALVWEVDAPSEHGTGASLDAYPAVPPSSCSSTPCSISPIWTAPIGTAAKFTIPATDSGRVYVGTRDGVLYGFGSPDSAPLAGMPLSFGKVAVHGKAKTLTATLTAATAVKVNGASTVSPSGRHPFSAGAPRVNGAAASWPVSLSPGDKLAVPVTFAPPGPGGFTGALQLATPGAANFPTVSVSLTGTGTAPGFYATPASYSFGTVTVGASAPAAITITNGSTRSEKIAKRARPAAPFSARLPALGKVLAAGQSITVPVKFAPQRAGGRTSSFSLTAGNGHGVTVHLSGTGAAAHSRLAPGRSSVSFGSVPLGHQATRTIQITNNGNLPATVTGSAAPRVPFGTRASVPAGLPLNPGYHLEVPVTFTPSSTGAVSASYALTWRDALGSHRLTVSLRGRGTAPGSGRAIPGPGGGWMLNGAASASGTSLRLVAAGRDKAGTAVYATPEPASGLTASFTARLRGQGGMTLALLGPRVGPAARGGAGGLLGFGGLHGVAVALDTGRFPGQSSANFVGIATGTAHGRLVYAATTQHVPDLRSGTHAVKVAVSGRKITVTVDGKSVLSATLSQGVIPPSALVALTGGTGGSGGSQTVTGTAVTAGASAVPPPGGGWSYNAAAQLSGSAAALTRAVRGAAGSVVYTKPVTTGGLSVTFTAQLSGGSGGEGLGFALLNPADAQPSSVGRSGGDVGLGGLTGTGVMLTTVKGGAFAWHNSASLVTSGPGGLTSLAQASAIPPLRTGPHTVTVRVSNGIVTVLLDGEQVLRHAAPGLTPTSALAFTGSTGTLTDVHVVRDVAISAAG